MAPWEELSESLKVIYTLLKLTSCCVKCVSMHSSEGVNNVF